MRKGTIITLASACVLFMAFIAAVFTVNAQTDLTPEQRARLEQELAQVEAEKKQAEADLANARNESASLSRDIKVLDAKIKAAQLEIKAKNLLIQSLGNDITVKERHIGNLEERIERGKETLAQILRKTNELDQYSLPEVMLSQSTVAGFFEDIDHFASVEQGLADTFEQIRSDKAETTSERDALDKRRNSEINARYEIEQERKNIEADEKEKQRLLNVSKYQERSYSEVVADRAARAAQIRATLFPLVGAKPIPFGEAYAYALKAEKQTGVRPAFLLGIFAQESSVDADATFGKHVGSCYLADARTGDGVKVGTGAKVMKVMKPDRDVEPFITITKALGADPFSTLVSCPWTTGYGGAMGPAQFIASTWMLVKDQLARLLDIDGMPNPWNPEHAFMASAMYLADLGADGRTYTAERNAACRYYSGASCGTRTGSNSYGNGVMAKAEKIQREMINPLQGL